MFVLHAGGTWKARSTLRNELKTLRQVFHDVGLGTGVQIFIMASATPMTRLKLPSTCKGARVFFARAVILMDRTTEVLPNVAWLGLGTRESISTR